MSDGLQRPLARLSRASCDEVVHLLMACETLRDPERRALLHKRLAAVTSPASAERGSLQDTVEGLVAACMAHELGLLQLIDAVRELEGASGPQAAIDAWLARHSGVVTAEGTRTLDLHSSRDDELSDERDHHDRQDADRDAPSSSGHDIEHSGEQAQRQQTAGVGGTASPLSLRGTGAFSAVHGSVDTALAGTLAEPGEGGQEASVISPGANIGSYRLTREIGQGGMGVVYEGRHVVLHKPAVIKMLRADLSSNPAAVARFAAEANFLAQLRHPGIVDVYDVGTLDDGTTFLVLELLAGESLEERLQRVGVLPVAVAASFMRQAARTLAAVHTHGIIHRDLKPANLFVVPDPEVPGGERIKILDFGIATLSTGGGARRTGRVLGTPGYMAPEQGTGADSIDARADLYALGIIFYRMLFGRLPFNRHDERDERMPRVRAHLAELAQSSMELAIVIERLLAEQPDERFESAGLLLQVLQNVSPDRSATRTGDTGSPPGGGSATTAPPGPLAPSPWRAAPARIPARQLAPLWRVPELPPHFLARPGDTESLIAALCKRESTGGDRGATPARKYGVHGMGGLGKSVIASAVARDEAIRHHFTDGVFWLSVGQTPQLTSLQAQLARALGVEDTAFDSPADGTHTLADFLSDRCALLILDDVWEPEHAAALEVVGPRGRTLLTTRNLDVLTWRDVVAYSLEVLSEEQALTLLADWVGTDVTTLDDDAARVAEACGRLPLALAIAGALVRKPSGTWTRVLTWLEEARLDKLRGRISAYPYRNVFKAIEASVTHLSEENVTDDAEACYIDLAVFAEDQTIPREALCVLWGRRGMDDADVDDLATSLATQALVTMDTAEAEEFCLRLHDIQRAYVRACVSDIADLHDQFVNAFAEHCDDGLVCGPRDDRAKSYFFSYLPTHLAAAGRQAELSELLVDYQWIAGKVKIAGVAELLADYEWCEPGSGTSLLRDALRLSGHVLARHPEQLASQLSGRLCHLGADHPVIGKLLDQLARATENPWLEAIVPHLTPPGGSLLCTFEGHREPVMSVGLSADGERAVSGSFDNSVKLWEPVSGTLVRIFEGHTDVVISVALSGDGDRVLSGSADGTARLWNARTGKLLCTFDSHQSPVTSVQLDGRGRHALTAGEDGAVKYWDTRSNKLVWADRGHTAAVNTVALAGAGKRVLSGSQDRTMRLLDSTNGEHIRTLIGHTSSVNCVSIDGAGKRALSGSDDQTLRLWDTETGKLVRTFVGHEAAVNAVALSVDGTRAVSGSDDQTVRLWDALDGRLLCTFTGHSHWVSSVAVSARGERILSGSLDHTVKLWRGDSNNAPSVSRQAGHQARVNTVVLDATGECALSGSEDGTAILWRTADGSIIRRLRAGAGGVRAVALAEDERYALIGSDGGEVSLWDLHTGDPVRAFDWRFAAVFAVALSGRGRVALVGTSDGSLTLWNARTGSCLETFAGHDAAVNSVALTADGKRALSGSSDGTVKLWNTATGTLLCKMSGHTESVVSVAFSADGRRALSGSLDCTIRLWDCHTGKTVQVCRGHASSIMSVALDAAGTFAFSGSYDRSVRLWDLDTGAPLLTCAHDAIVTSCACSLPRSPILVIGDDEGHVGFLRLHNVPRLRT